MSFSFQKNYFVIIIIIIIIILAKIITNDSQSFGIFIVNLRIEYMVYDLW